MFRLNNNQTQSHLEKITKKTFCCNKYVTIIIDVKNIQKNKFYKCFRQGV